MNDIELAMSAGNEIGRLYSDGKSFSEVTPVLALTFFRGFANAYCRTLDKSSHTDGLAERIRNIDRSELLPSRCIKLLKILQINGNKAAHPESYDFVKLDFYALASESLNAARVLIEQLLLLRDGTIPAYELTSIRDGVLRDMCANAMLERDIQSMYMIGAFFLERAERAPDFGIRNQDGFAISAKNDIEQAAFWLKQAADEGHPIAQYQYGHYLTRNIVLDKERIRTGEVYIRRAADQENADALFYVGTASIDGSPLFTKDEVYAREVLELAAKQEHPKALAQLGAMYNLGLGGLIDKGAAAKLTIQAAKAGIPFAQFNLYAMYTNGDGTAQNKNEGIKSLQEAASQDFPVAIYTLAGLVAAGEISGINKREAIHEYERAYQFQEFRATSALNIAKLLESYTCEISEMLKAATYLQDCYSLIANTDQHDLQKECLDLCKKVVGKIREHVRVHGTDPSLNGGEISTSALFDRNFIPVLDRTERMQRIAQLLENSSEPTIAFKLLNQEACFDVKSSSTNIGLRNIENVAGLTERRQTVLSTISATKVRPNDPCPCGSGMKYKRCHRG